MGNVMRKRKRLMITAAQRSKQGFEFMNCGADILAVTAWMGAEMARLKGLLVKKVEAEVVESKGGDV